MKPACAVLGPCRSGFGQAELRRSFTCTVNADPHRALPDQALADRLGDNLRRMWSSHHSVLTKRLDVYSGLYLPSLAEHPPSCLMLIFTGHACMPPLQTAAAQIFELSGPLCWGNER